MCACVRGHGHSLEGLLPVVGFDAPDVVRNGTAQSGHELREGFLELKNETKQCYTELYTVLYRERQNSVIQSYTQCYTVLYREGQSSVIQRKTNIQKWSLIYPSSRLKGFYPNIDNDKNDRRFNSENQKNTHMQK